MNAVNKQQIKDDLVAHIRKQLIDDAAAARAERGEAVADQTLSVDDLSQQDFAGDLNVLMDVAGDRQRKTLEQVRDLDMSPKTTVEPGAIVGMHQGELFLVGVAVDEFHSGGKAYAGMSVDSPMYAAAKGLSAGEKFEFRGKQRVVESVD